MAHRQNMIVWIAIKAFRHRNLIISRLTPPYIRRSFTLSKARFIYSCLDFMVLIPETSNSLAMSSKRCMNSLFAVLRRCSLLKPQCLAKFTRQKKKPHISRPNRSLSLLATAVLRLSNFSRTLSQVSPVSGESGPDGLRRRRWRHRHRRSHPSHGRDRTRLARPV